MAPAARIALAAGLLAAACGRPIVLGSVERTLPGGVHVRIQREASGPAAATRYRRFGGHAEFAGPARFYYDAEARIYSGYELNVRPLGNGQFSVVVEGLGGPLAELPASPESEFRSVPPPPLPPPRVLKDGEAFEIDLVRDGTRARLFDRIVVSLR
jgi:hypothetical protein